MKPWEREWSEPADDMVVTSDLQAERDETRRAILLSERETLAAEGVSDPNLEREIELADAGHDFSGRKPKPAEAKAMKPWEREWTVSAPEAAPVAPPVAPALPGIAAPGQTMEMEVGGEFTAPPTEATPPPRKTGSVTDSIPQQMPGGPPVTPETQRAIEAASIANPAVKARPDFVGQAARLNDPAIQARVKMLYDLAIKRGAKPEAAQAWADSNATLPDAEVASASTLDFETATATRNAGVLPRAGKKALITATQQAGGLVEAALDMVGADANRAKDLNATYQRSLEAMGDAREGAGYMEQQLEGALTSIATQGPQMLYAVLGGPGAAAVGLGAMFTQVAGQEYTQGRQQGLKQAEALERAAFMGTAEVVGERVGLPGAKAFAQSLLKAGTPAKELLPKFAVYLAKENVGEQITSGLQFGYDAMAEAGLKKDSTIEDYLRAVRDTGVQTTIQTLLTGGAGRVARTLSGEVADGERAAASAAAAEKARAAALAKWGSFNQLLAGPRAAQPAVDPGAEERATEEAIAASTGVRAAPSEADLAAARRQIVDFKSPNVAAMKADNLTSAPGVAPPPVGNEIPFEGAAPDPAAVEQAQALETARQADAATRIPPGPVDIPGMKAENLGLAPLEPVVEPALDIKADLEAKALARGNALQLVPREDRPLEREYAEMAVEKADGIKPATDRAAELTQETGRLHRARNVGGQWVVVPQGEASGGEARADTPTAQAVGLPAPAAEAAAAAPVRTEEPKGEVARPRPAEESDQDRSHREWRENYDRVVNAPDLGTESVKDIERAISYASNRRQSEARKGWDGGTANKSLIDSIDREVEFLKAEVRRREVPSTATPPGPFFTDYTAPAAIKSKDGKTTKVYKGEVRTFKTEAAAQKFITSQVLRGGWKPRDSGEGWVISKPAPPPLTPAEAAKKRADKRAIRATDSAVQMVEKSGGWNWRDAAQDGVDPKQKERMPFLFRMNGGLTMDGIAEVLHQNGFNVMDETGAIDATKAREIMESSFSGQVYSPEGANLRRAKDEEARAKYEARHGKAEQAETEYSEAVPEVQAAAAELAEEDLDAINSTLRYAAAFEEEISDEAYSEAVTEAEADAADGGNPGPADAEAESASAADRQENDRASAPEGELAPDLALTGETEAEIRAREAREKATADAKQQRDAAPDPSGFTLTGSDSPADKARARGQQELTPSKGVEDFGEKMRGARKDMAPSLTREITDDAIASEPFSKTWPAEEVDQIEDKFAAAVAFAARAEVPAKPRVPYKVKRWVEKVKTVRELASQITSGKFPRDEFLKRMEEKPGLQDFRSKVLLLETQDRAQWSRIESVGIYPEAYRIEDGKKVSSPYAHIVIDGRSHQFGGQFAGSVDELAERVSALLGTPAAEKKMQFEVRGRPGAYAINKKGDKEYRKLKTFADSKEALAYVREHHDELVAAWDGVKERDNVRETDVRNTENRPRTAADHRKGKDVTPEKFATTFGFRGVEFGNWVSQGAQAKERQGMLNQAYDALLDLADIVGIPPEAISLDGTLGIAFGSRGHGWASAHFEPSNLVINLTKTRGAGTLAHEWLHALDNYFARQRGGEVPIARGLNAQQAYREQNFITYRPEPMLVHTSGRSSMTKAELERRRKEHPSSGFYAAENWSPDTAHPQGVRPQVEKAWADVVQALNESPMAGRSRMIDKTPDAYWSQVIERGARSFENYVISKMMERGYNNDYLANVRDVTDFPRAKERYPYLLPDEVAPIAQAFDALFSVIETKKTDRGTAMYRRGVGVSASIRAAIREAEAVVKDAKVAVPIEVVATPSDLPFDAADDSKGAYHEGKVWLVASNLKDRLDAETTLAHELQHAGIDVRFPTPEAREMALRDLLSKNEKLRSIAMAWRAQYGKEFLAARRKRGRTEAQAKSDLTLESMEEAVAYFAQRGEAFTGLKQFVAKIAKAMRARGFKALPDWLEKATDAEALAFIAETRAATERPAGLMPEQGREAKAARAGFDVAADAMRWAQVVDQHLAGTLPPRDAITVTRTPNAVDALGFKDQAVTITPSIIDKALRAPDGRHGHELEVAVVKGVVRGLHDPVAIFSNPEGGISVVTALESRGRPVLIGLKPDAAGGRNTVTAIRTIHAKDFPAVLKDWANDGRLEFVDQRKRPEWLTTGEGLLSLRVGPAARGVKGRILTEADLVNPPVGPEPKASRTGFSAPLDFPGVTPPDGKAPPPPGNASPVSPANADPPSVWNVADPSRLDTTRRVLQDRHIDTKRVVEAITANGKAVADEVDVYLREELYHGRAAHRTDTFINQELKPLLQDMVAAKVSLAELEEYLHARHAEEANKHVAARNKDMPDGGSGMTTAAARAYLAGLPEGKRKALESVAIGVDSIIAGTRQLIVSDHLESAATVDGWAGQFQHYVPLQREDMGGTPGIGQGFSVKGPASKERVGSKRAVVDILANIALQRERAIVRGEKNRVATALLGLAHANPNPDFWTVDKPPIVRSVDKETNTVVERVDHQYKSQDNVVIARVGYGDGQITERAVLFNEHDERAKAMALALKNLDTDQLTGVMWGMGKATRFLASVNTQYNPVFGVKNFIRDVQSGLVNLASTELAGKQVEVAKHVLSALGGIYVDVRAERHGKGAHSKWADLWEEFQTVGGKTGFRDMFADSKERAKALQTEIKRAQEGMAMGSARAVFDWLSDYNTTMENAVRLAAYKVARDQGLSKDRAASLAKNLTVNFNRKGQITTQAGALYAFFNANVQGNTRLAQTLADPNVSTAAKTTALLSVAGRKIVAGGILLGVMQAVLLAVTGFDEDEPPEFEREKNYIIPTGGKTYLKIPMGLGLHVLPNIGRVGAEYALHGFKDPGKRLVGLLGTFLDAFNPVGGTRLSFAGSLQLLSPTVSDPLVALATNEDWTGKPIARHAFKDDKDKPGFTRAKDSATLFGKLVAEGLNYASGGTEHRAGKVSPTPDQIDYLVGQVTGGVGREISKLEQTGRAIVMGDPLPVNKRFFVSGFYGDAASPAAQRGRFYDNLRDLAGHKAELDGRKSAKQPIVEYLRENPEARLVRQGQLRQAEREITALNKRRREAIATHASPEAVQRIEDKITAVMTRFNEHVKKAKSK